MYIVTCIELNVVALCMCLMICFMDRTKNSDDIFGHRHFNRLLWMTILILALNTMSWVIEGFSPKNGANLHLNIMTLFFLMQTLLALELLKYCTSAYNYRLPVWLKVICYIPVVATTVLLIVNHFHPFAYRISSDGVYERMPLFPLVIISALIHILCSVGVCAVRCFMCPSYEKDHSLKMLIFTLTILISAVFSTVIYGFTPWPIISLALVFIHISIHSKQTRELGMLAYKDALTGVQNSTAHSFSMKTLDERMQITDTAFAIAVVDVNDLKLINDSFGHDAGDRLLIRAAQLICEIFAHSPVHRIGGDEFSIILEGYDYENRDILLKRIIREMPYATYKAGSRELSVSMAIGMAEYDPHRHTHSSDVFQAADRAMYANKKQFKKRFR